ncbi:oxidoreductase [Bifidobacterium sp. DSM 109958]|uniref:Oxidoreductase n=1 Tax=Bifidobacterium moraviense TaxID=2675323 RepID=A0A7Y0HZI6_9BIFI|nr:Gfo/Idh/MocA family oxidoreductase [Bifidobacterium sp. DSM 109958]NMN00265.1 oxidoreductase [Bifidobacterium sp. DSM 109958]
MHAPTTPTAPNASDTSGTPHAPDARVRVALIGTGGMGRQYAELIRDHPDGPLVLTAACCRSPESQRWAAEALGPGTATYPSVDELYRHADDFDAVLIVTQQELHPALAVQAFEHGKHVLCDKPAARSLGECRAMTEAADRTGLTFGMIFQQRCYARHRRVRQLLRDGALGEVRRMQLTDTQYFRTVSYHHSRPWRSSWEHEGGGVLTSQGPHILDLWQWLFGMPSAMRAVIPFGKYNDFAVDDESTLVMTYPDGRTGAFVISTGEPVPETRLDIRGSRGRLLMDGDVLRLWTYDRDADEYRRTAACTDARELGIAYREERIPDPVGLEHYWEVLENFGFAVMGEAELIADGREGLRCLELADAAYLSAWDDATVALPLDADRFDRELRAHVDEERAQRAEA